MDMNDIAGHHDVLSRFALSERAEPALSSGSPTPDLSTSKCSYQDEPTGGPCRGSDPVGCDQPLGYVGVVPFGIARWWPNSNQAVCVGRGLSQQDGQQLQKLQVQPEKEDRRRRVSVHNPLLGLPCSQRRSLAGESPGQPGTCCNAASQQPASYSRTSASRSDCPRQWNPMRATASGCLSLGSAMVGVPTIALDLAASHSSVRSTRDQVRVEHPRQRRSSGQLALCAWPYSTREHPGLPRRPGSSWPRFGLVASPRRRSRLHWRDPSARRAISASRSSCWRR